MDEVENMPRWRLVCIGLAMLAGLLVLASRLREIQIENAPVYVNEQLRQSIRRVILPAPRGRIFDRRGVCLADNRPEYCIAIYIEELRRPGRWSRTIDAVDRKVDEMADFLGMPRQITRDDIEQHVLKRLPLPLLAWRGIDARIMARFAENPNPPPGFDLYVQAARIYPKETLAAHVLGYVGRDRPVMTNMVFHYDIMGMRGRAGMEQAANTRLAGTPGGQLITVDVNGYKHSAENREAVPGSDLHLVLDADLQEVLERLLGDRRAAGVVIDPRNGDVLAMASQPDFNPNNMSPAISTADWKRLIGDTGRPLLNRTISGSYPPGSIFKPVVALAAIEGGFAREARLECNGVFTLGGMRLRCWSRQGHGPLAIRQALEQSCNPFFCELGVNLGLEPIRQMALQLGMGAPTGIEIAGEASGIIPSDAWKRRVQRDAWRAGDTANIAIGQGLLAVTPLQMAVYAAALANGGRVLRPRLVADPDLPEGECIRQLDMTSSLATVRGGMYDVVQAQRGTGARAAVRGLAMAGKTGTAEYGPVANRGKHAWMIAFAPFDEPRVAMAILVENAESGGRTAAPIIKALMRHIFSAELPPEEPPEGDTEEPERPEDAA